LSEEIHKKWLAEFYRILKPGGLLIATTRPRRFIMECADHRRLQDLPFYLTGAAASFPDSQEALRDYDGGRYCFSGTGGGGVRDSSFYGEACISKAYVEREWPSVFSFVTFLEDSIHRAFDQNVIVARK
jgi:hypothetical protein